MNEDKPASRTGISEPPPSLLEKVRTHPLGAAAGVAWRADDLDSKVGAKDKGGDTPH